MKTEKSAWPFFWLYISVLVFEERACVLPGLATNDLASPLIAGTFLFGK